MLETRSERLAFRQAERPCPHLPSGAGELGVRRRVRTPQRAMPQTTPTPTLRCADPECGAPFVAYRPGQKYHSAKCRKRDWMRRRLAKPGVGLVCPKCREALALRLVTRDS